MATLYQKKIDPDNSLGTHYTSAALWEAAFGGTTDGDLVGDDQRVLGELYCTDGTADGAVNIAGWVSSDSDHDIELTVVAAHRHLGEVPDSGNRYRIEATGSYAVKVEEDHCSVNFVAAKLTASGNYASCLYLRACQGSSFNECVAEVVCGSYSSIRCFTDYNCTTGTNRFRNCLALGALAGSAVAFWVQNRTGGTVRLDHCGAPEGILGLSGTGNSGCSIIARNSYCYTSSTSFGITTSGTVYCGYKTGGAPPNGSNSIDLSAKAAADLWLDPSGGNYRTERDEVLHLAAPTLYADANPVLWDILGNPRPATGNACVGPFEWIFASGGGTLPTLVGAGEATVSSTSITASGGGTLPALTGAGTATLVYTASGRFLLMPPSFTGTAVASQVAPLPSAVLHGYETWPLDPEWDLVETWLYNVLVTPPDAEAAQGRAVRSKPLRSWRLRWSLATEAEKDIVLGFHRDMRGATLPFWFPAPDKIPRPYKAPALALVQGGSQPARTVYATFTWGRGEAETTPCVVTGVLAVPQSHLLSLKVPEFPQNVSLATVYLGPTEEILYRQDDQIVLTAGTWTEPTAGYGEDGDPPPTVNSLSETVLVHFAEEGLRWSRSGPDQYEMEIVIEELWVENPRAYFATGGFTLEPVVFSGAATTPRRLAAGGWTIPAPAFTGEAERTGGTHHTATGGFSIPATEFTGTAAIKEAGDYYVSATGDDEDPGTFAEPFATIQHAVTTAASGSRIIVLPGTYEEKVTVNGKTNLELKASGAVTLDATGETHGFYSSGGASDLTIDGFEVTGAAQGVYSLGNDRVTLRNLAVHDCLSGGIMVKGTRSGTTITSGIDCEISSCDVHHIGLANDSCGIVLDACKRATVQSCIVYLAHSDGVRDIRGESNEIASNNIILCGAGIGLANETTAALVQNNRVHYCIDGVYARATNGRIGFSDIRHNSLTWNCAALNFGYDYPGADYVRATYNLLEFSGDQHVLYNPAAMGSHVTIDYNCYHSRSDRPTSYWDNTTDAYSTVNDIQHSTSFEDHGVEWRVDTYEDYGALGYPTGAPTFTPIDVVPEAASHNANRLLSLCDWKYDTVWMSGTGSASNATVTFDLETAQEFEYVFLMPWGDLCEHTPRNLKILTSDNGSDWDEQLAVLNTNGYGLKWYQLSAPVEARYLRLLLVDKFPTDSFSWTNNEFKFAAVAVGNVA